MSICTQWLANPLKNPRSNRPIKKNGPTYQALERECVSVQQVLPPKKAAIPVKKAATPVKKAATRPVDLTSICTQWLANPLKNPRTNRPIKKNSPTYQALERECVYVQQILPPKKAATPVKKAATPVKKAATPVKKAATPVKKAATFVKKAATPVKKAATPVKKAATPVKKAATPVKKAATSPVNISKNDKDLISAALKLVVGKKIKLNACNIVEDRTAIKNLQTKLLKKNSVSPSEGILCDIELLDGTKVRVFLKFWPNLYELNFNAYQYGALDYEKDVYTYVTDKILIPKQSINFIPILAFGKCPYKATLQSLAGNLTFNIPGVFKHQPTNLHVMVTGSSPTVQNLTDTIELVKNNEYEKASIVFQIFHALYCLAIHKISHVDLHTGNIMVDILREPIVLQYTTNGLVAKFKTNFIVKIYDFDRSVMHQSQNKNPYYKNVANLWTYANPLLLREQRDYQQVLCSLLKNQYFAKIIKKLLPPTAPDNLAELLNHGMGLKFQMDVSSETANKIRKEPMIFPNSRFYVLKMDKLQAFMTPLEWKKLSTYKDFPIISSLYFELGPNKNTLDVHRGFACEMKHDLKDTVVYPLKDFFTTPTKFNLLASLLKVSAEKADEIVALTA